MNDQLKSEIIVYTKQYMQAKGLSQNVLAKETKINVAYLSAMLKGELTLMVGDRPTVIADKWFVIMADFVGFVIVKQNWQTQPTPQFLTTLSLLESAKQYPQALMIIGNTGYGKTHAIDKFCNKYPVHTYRLTVADHYKIKDVVNELCSLLSIPTVGLNFDKLNRINSKLVEIRRSGGEPTIIIDEAENMKISTLRMVKSLYDKVIGHSSIVLIGTEDLVHNIEVGVTRGYSGLPQFNRRFKAGTRRLPAIDRTFKQILSAFNFEPALNKLLVSLSENYGELHDFIIPAMREADRLGEVLTENLFRKIFNMPK